MSIQSDLKIFLQERGVSQKQFAEIAGVNPCALSKFMRRKGVSMSERITPYLYGDLREAVYPTPTEAPDA